MCFCTTTAQCGDTPCRSAPREGVRFRLRDLESRNSGIHTIYFPGRDDVSRNRHERRARQAKWRKGKL